MIIVMLISGFFVVIMFIIVVIMFFKRYFFCWILIIEKNIDFFVVECIMSGNIFILCERVNNVCCGCYDGYDDNKKFVY